MPEKEKGTVGKVILGLAAFGSVILYSTTRRRQIVRITEEVVPYKKDHAKNKIVTQGRAVWPNYSGCGDLWNYVLDMIGAPNSWVNRNSPRRGLKWKTQVNISQPFWEAKKAGARVKFKKGGPWPKEGDMVLIGREPQELAHVFIILKKLGPRHYKTAEYGGANNESRIGERKFSESGIDLGPWRRQLVGWIDADKIPIEKKWAPGRMRSILGVGRAA